MTGAGKTREYEMTGARKTDEYEPMGAQNVRVDKSEKPCVQAEKSAKSRAYKTVHVSECGRMLELKSFTNNQRNRACHHADVKPIVRDSMDDDRVLVKSSGAEMTLVPHEPSEFEKTETSSHSHPMSTMVHHASKHKRNHTNEQSASSKTSELPVIQCDYLMLKDVPGTGGLKVLSMYVRTFGYGMSRVVETRGPNRHVRNRENVELPWTLGHHSAV